MRYAAQDGPVGVAFLVGCMFAPPFKGEYVAPRDERNPRD